MNHSILSIFDEIAYKLAIDHRNVHKCGSYPFNHGIFLNQLATKINAHSILEIGTGVGYSALCLAKNNSPYIKTIDLNIDHFEIARELWKNNKIDHLIDMEIVDSEFFLIQCKLAFDIVFVDAFAPTPSEVEKYVQLIDNRGVLVSTNHNWNKSTPEFIEMLRAQKTNFQLLDKTIICSDSPETLKSCVELWTTTIDTTL